jgi:AcrR family transcriptional regulator
MVWSEPKGPEVRLTREDWLAAGIELLRAEGAGALTIDRLTRRLGVTKGSFYHHFGSREEFSHALLGQWERRLTQELIASSRGGADFAESNRRLTSLSEQLSDPGLELAIRAWALQDPGVMAHQERVDRQRLAYLGELYGLLGGDPERTIDLALIRYAFVVGAQQIRPPLEPADLARVFELLQRQLERMARSTDNDPGGSP